MITDKTMKRNSLIKSRKQINLFLCLAKNFLIIHNICREYKGIRRTNRWNKKKSERDRREKKSVYEVH